MFGLQSAFGVTVDEAETAAAGFGFEFSAMRKAQAPVVGDELVLKGAAAALTVGKSVGFSQPDARRGVVDLGDGENPAGPGGVVAGIVADRVGVHPVGYLARRSPGAVIHIRRQRLRAAVGRRGGNRQRHQLAFVGFEAFRQIGGDIAVEILLPVEVAVGPDIGVAHEAIVVVGIQRDAQRQLLDVGDAGGLLGRTSRAGQRWKQNRRENRNDCNYD
ncbi:hypothetical protein SDC9_145748 [bioreactor metagenome]|uniref:Uncharacterized protein n=1 Tax=bioreactor metagenome TaxID=1076179 RepID=A0A645E9T0_9ZZZZ